MFLSLYFEKECQRKKKCALDNDFSDFTRTQISRIRTCDRRKEYFLSEVYFIVSQHM